MAASASSFGTLSVTLAQAITWLTRSLITSYSATTIIKLQLALEANLTAQFQTSWVPSEPLRGSGRRCLTLSPSCIPPRPVYNACKSAGVEWSKWIALMGGMEFDLFIDPGCVSVRFGHLSAGKSGKFFVIWAEDIVAPKPKSVSEDALQAQLKAQAQARALAAAGKTLAQQIISEDADEDEELFALLADEVREPVWVTPIASRFPAVPPPPRSTSSSPVSIISASSSHSRSSSCSSSSAFSFSSCGSTDSYGSATTISQCSTSPDSSSPSRLSRRERARQARVFIDTTKTEVTNYDGGKTTVLTGGVMLGAAPKPKLAALAASAVQRKLASSSTSGSWRSLCA
jgi:hypothetical protein